jgi:hypothetical protein
MKLKFYFSLFLSFSLSLFLSSCSLFNNSSSEVADFIPYASTNELSSLPITDVYPSWDTIRKLAIIEFEGTNDKEKLGITGDYSLSDFPIVIYDNDTYPYRYEYIVSDSNGHAVGTIATVTRKGLSSNIIMEIMPYVRDYSTIMKSSDDALFAIKYPYEILSSEKGGIGSKSIIESTVDVDDPSIAFQQLALLSDQDLLDMGYPDRETMKTLIQSNIDIVKTNSNIFWENATAETKQISKMSDLQLKHCINANKARATATSTTSEKYIVSKYNYGASNNDYTKTIWYNGSYCGPAALCNMYISISQTYGNCSLAGAKRFSFYDSASSTSYGANASWVNTNVSPKDGGLYYDIATKTGCFSSKGPVFATSFNGAINYVTNSAYGVSISMMTSKEMYNRLVTADLPAAWWVLYDHYCTIIGVDRETYTYSTGATNVTGQYLIYDNGYLTNGYNYRPIWRTVSTGAVWYYVYPMKEL